jgi:hypothetical protein
MRGINCHPVKRDEDRSTESILDMDDWLNWNGDLDNPKDSEQDCTGDDETDIEHNTGIEDPDSPNQQDLRAAPNVPRLVQPTRKSKRQTEKLFVIVNAVETRRNKGRKKK